MAEEVPINCCLTPACKGPAIVAPADRYTRYYVWCACCDAYGPSVEDPDAAIAAWNESAKVKDSK